MRKSKFTESQIVGVLAEGDAGLPVAEICRKHGISNGRVSVDESKLRLSSDCFEICCWSKEKVRIAISLDCCDKAVGKH
jgi:putative transposase